MKKNQQISQEVVWQGDLYLLRDPFHGMAL